jgi:hypothetical protein
LFFATSDNKAYPVSLRSTQIAIATSDNADMFCEIPFFKRNNFLFFKEKKNRPLAKFLVGKRLHVFGHSYLTRCIVAIVIADDVVAQASRVPPIVVFK